MAVEAAVELRHSGGELLLSEGIVKLSGHPHGLQHPFCRAVGPAAYPGGVDVDLIGAPDIRGYKLADLVVEAVAVELAVG